MEKMNKIKIVVLMGGKSAEREVSLSSGREVVRHLNKNKYDILPVVISKDGLRWELKDLGQLLLCDPLLKKENCENFVSTKENIRIESLPQKAKVVFIAMHGNYGEDGSIQGLLEMAGVPYTGAGVLASALGMNKIMFRKVMQAEKIPMARALVLSKKDNPQVILKEFKFPFVIKPFSQGSSVGITIIKEERQLKDGLKLAFEYGSKIIVEEYLSGVEVTCGVIGNSNPLALPIAEIVSKNEFFDYEAKYTPGKSEEIVPARLTANLAKKVQNLAIKVYNAVDCQGFGRVDMIIRENKIFILEINTIPGLTPNSLLPKEAAAAGISFPQLLDKIINLALEK